MHKSIKKLIPHFLILIILVGLFSPIAQVNAQAAMGVHTAGTGSVVPTAGKTGGIVGGTQQEIATSNNFGTCVGGDSATTNAMDCANSGGLWQPKTTTPTSNNVLEDNLKSCAAIVTGNFDGCVEKIFFYLFYGIPSFLLGLSAQFFNALISLTLSSKLYSDANSFITNAWTVVRDFSNIFFILILLYIAIETILGLGHETKKIIVHVIIMALLINFSMFFTKVVIDSSNILALIFYNKINVDMQATGNTDHRFYVPFTDSSKTGIEEKDVSGGLVSAFDPSRMLSQDFFDKYKTETQAVGSKLGLAAYVGGGAAAGALFAPLAPITATGGAIIGGVAYGVKTVYGYFLPTQEVPTAMILAIILISGLIMSFAAYAFFVTGISFMARLIELWILIIFAPFAFMSWSIPKLSGVTYLGWEAWTKRLLEVSFMAPVFMFLLYIIFMFVNAKIFNNLQNEQGALQAIFMIVLPALVTLILLLKATKWAKEKSGELGEMVMKGAKIAGGAGLLLATGGTALALRAGVGAAASGAASSKTLQEGAKATGFKGMASRMALRTADYGTKASFDVRNAPGIGSLAKSGGLNLGTPIKGYTEARADKVKKHQERAKQLEVGEDEEMKQKLNNSEQDLQKMLNLVTKDFEKIDEDLVSARQKKSDSKEGTPDHDKAVADIKRLTGEKTAIKNGGFNSATGKYNTVDGLIGKEAVDAADKEEVDSLANLTAAKTAKTKAVADATAAMSVKTAAKTASAANPSDVLLANAALAAEKAANDASEISTRAVVNETESLARYTAARAENAKAKTAAKSGTGKSIKGLEKDVHDTRNEILTENRERKWKYAEREEKWNHLWTGGKYNTTDIGRRTIREANHKIRMEHKIESSGGKDDHSHSPKPTHSPKPPAAPSGGGHGPSSGGGAPAGGGHGGHA